MQSSLEQFLIFDSKKIEDHIAHMVKSVGSPQIHHKKNFWIYASWPNECPMCLVAHWDTLASYPLTIQRTGNIVTSDGSSPLGADDRAGVWGILEVVRRLSHSGRPLPSVLFTNFEEIGGLGVKDWIATMGKACRSVFFIEMDRKGANEYVYYSEYLPKPIRHYVESFGYIADIGTYSDVSDISKKLLIPSVNVSVGYHHPHCSNERLHIDELLLSVERVVSMCLRPMKELHALTDERRAILPGWLRELRINKKT